MTGDMRHALDERRELIDARADATLDAATADNESWIMALGSAPRDPRKVATWRRHARTVAANRDRYGITEDSPLGPMPESTAQKIDHARARAAMERAQAVTPLSASGSAPGAAAGRHPVGPTI